MRVGDGVVLALDTATPDLSAAVVGPNLRESVRVPVGNRMAAAIAPEVDGLLQYSGLARGDLAAIAVGAGPGPYTSLRVGLMFARAVGWALGIPVLGACSLDVVARAVSLAGAGAFGVALDARRREVYWAGYDAEGRRRVGPLVARPADIGSAATRWFGPGLVDSSAGAGMVERRGPDALVLADWVRSDGERAIEVTEGGGPQIAAAEAEMAGRDSVWAAPDGDGSGAKSIPQSLLPPRPLYLRRPDAKVPSWLS